MKQYFFNLFNELLVHDPVNEYIFFYFEHNLEELEKLYSDNWRQNAVLLERQDEVHRFLDKIDLYFCPFHILCPRPLPVPTVYTIPDIQEAFYPRFFSNYLRVARAYHYVSSSKMADRIITISDFSKNSIVRYHKIPQEKVIVAHLCVDAKFYHAKENSRAPDLPLPERYIFFPANHWVHKNHDFLLRAVSWLKREKQFSVNVVLTGFDKEDGYHVGQNVKELGLSDQVFQLGYVSVEEMAYLYRHAEMLVFPSLFEGFGIPLVEAMAAGCPILAARTTSLPEIGGDAALYFDPSASEELGDAMLELWHNAELRDSLVARGRERLKFFSADQMAARHLEAFSQAVSVFSRRRYLWNRYVSKYFHAAKTLLIPEFYGMLYDIFMRKLRTLRSKIGGLKTKQ